MAIILNGQTNDVTIGGVSVATDNEVIAALAQKANSSDMTIALGLKQDTSSAVTITHAQALHETDALRISGSTVSLYKGDGTNESITLPSSTPTTTDVLNSTAAASVGAVGTYAFLLEYGVDLAARAPGDILAGSYLSFGCVVTGYTKNGITTASGTWRLMGSYSYTAGVNDYPISIWLRIS